MPEFKPSTLLIIDDEPLNLAMLSSLLSPHYRVLAARSGDAALTLLESQLPDLILLDVVMPEMGGPAMLTKLKLDPRTAEIPVIFVSALGTEANEEMGLAMGAVDYIVKPIRPAIVLARVRAQLELKHARDRLAEQNQWLEHELARRLHDGLVAQDLALFALAELAETRENESSKHLLRIQAYVQALARRLQREPAYAAQLDDAHINRIAKAAPLHDIGKIGIRDAILLKPGKLTAEEFEQMKAHTRIGGDTIAKAIHKTLAIHKADRPGRNADGVGSPMPDAVKQLEVARDIALYHHERWDGRGYPEGLVGDRIPLPARLMSVADVFDALTMRRVYKHTWSAEEATRYIAGQSGKMFDPGVVAAFQDISPEFAAIAARLGD